MFRKYLLASALVLFTQSSFAMIILQDDAIDCSLALSGWRKEVEDLGRTQIKSGEFLNSTGLMQCRQTKQLENVIICQSFLQLHMNLTFGRASIFAEGGYELPARSLAPHNHLDMQKLNLTTQGHDLKSADLSAFFKLAELECAKGNKDVCLNSFEAEFKKNVYDPISKRFSKFVILGFSFQSFDDYQSNVGHEFMHAQYFLEENYRQGVEIFWKKHVPESDKREIRQVLSGEAYDATDEELMRNEFQAFVLEPGGEQDRLAKFSVKYRDPLSRALSAAGATPILIK